MEMDWFFVSMIASVISFVISLCFTFRTVMKAKPHLLHRITHYDSDTTYNWNLIIAIVGKCTSFAGGIFLVFNVLVFLVTGHWQIEPKSIGVLAISFLLLLLQSFDRFVTKLIR
jgi:hypothetical protein